MQEQARQRGMTAPDLSPQQGHGMGHGGAGMGGAGATRGGGRGGR
jgi:hypothetical protein